MKTRLSNKTNNYSFPRQNTRKNLQATMGIFLSKGHHTNDHKAGVPTDVLVPVMVKRNIILVLVSTFMCYMAEASNPATLPERNRFRGPRWEDLSDDEEILYPERGLENDDGGQPTLPLARAAPASTMPTSCLRPDAPSFMPAKQSDPRISLTNLHTRPLMAGGDPCKH